MRIIGLNGVVVCFNFVLRKSFVVSIFRFVIVGYPWGRQRVGSMGGLW